MVTVSSLWVGGSLSDLEINCIKSHLKVGHNFVLYVYENIDNIPNGVLIKDGREILNERHLGLGDKYGFYPFSDIFRFNLMYKKGGYWVDLDLYATRSWDSLEDKEFIFASERTIQKGAYRNRTKDKVATICMLKAPPKSVFYYDLCSKVDNPKFKINRRDACMIEIRKLIEKYNLEKHVVDFYLFCGVDWWNAKEMFLNTELKDKYGVEAMSKEEVLDRSFGLHFWRHLIVNKFGKYGLTNNFEEKSLYNYFLN